MGLDKSGENTQMPQNVSAQAQKFGISMKKRLHWASVVRAFLLSAIVLIVPI